ncbi:MAG TPA: hypothetical protein VGN42_10970 [Pirellulales bacterium]|jgi:hypothetical protein|nr:hypothetical protein [Pirellulales bacterium]
MKILFAIPHFYDPAGGGRYGSLSPDPRPRVQALSACLATLHHVFGQEQKQIDIARRVVVPANQAQRNEIEIVICTSGDRHLLAQLPVPQQLYWHRPSTAEPMLLGFECQQVLREALGKFDYYCYLEDDLLLADPWFFFKLAWFNRLAGDGCLLQPHRYEMLGHVAARKVYIDGDLRPEVYSPFCDLDALPEIAGEALGVPVAFRPARNPHSGCYFLSAAQMAHWAAQPHFLDRDASFVGPLESAATLGVLRTFKIYKPAREQAAFLEIQHYGSQFLAQVGAQLPIVEE